MKDDPSSEEKPAANAVGAARLDRSAANSCMRDKRGPQGLPIESESEGLVAGVAAIEIKSGNVLSILEFITGVEEIFDLQVLPNIRRGEILAPHQWFEQPSVVTMKGGMWEARLADEEDGAEAPGVQSPD
jgi:hypothetical protein